MDPAAMPGMVAGQDSIPRPLEHQLQHEYQQAPAQQDQQMHTNIFTGGHGGTDLTRAPAETGDGRSSSSRPDHPYVAHQQQQYAQTPLPQAQWSTPQQLDARSQIYKGTPQPYSASVMHENHSPQQQWTPGTGAYATNRRNAVQ